MTKLISQWKYLSLDFELGQNTKAPTAPTTAAPVTIAGDDLKRDCEIFKLKIFIFTENK